MNATTPAYFDYLPVAHAAGLTDPKVEQLFSAILADYGGDQMMAELRMLRICKAIASGVVTVEQVLREISS